MKPLELVERGTRLFTQRSSLMSLWQEIARNFYPQRADFTAHRSLGEDFAGDLYSSYPLLVQRELSTSFAAMLRPRRSVWFNTSVEGYKDLNRESKEFLQWATARQRAAMYQRQTHFIRATTQGDSDFSAFGQCAIERSTIMNAKSPHLHYRCWHLRDVAWAENDLGVISEIYVRWKPTLRELQNKGFSLHRSRQNVSSKKLDEKINCYRVMISTDIHQGQMGEGQGYDWVVSYIDIDNQYMMREQGLNSHGFTIPRWQTVSGSQYAYSPATVAGLPDARLLQAMSLTLLEAGEMSVRPAMIATQDALRSDAQIFPGGITWADAEFSDHKYDVLRPLNQDRRGLPMGYENREDQRTMLAQAFYLNKLTLPAPQTEMTAYETAQRVEEYIRTALPLFEPMEYEYNGGICDDTFDAMMDAGAFGSPEDMPKQLQGRDIEFEFQSPLHDAIERKDAGVFMESANLIEAAMQMDPTAVYNMDVGGALRDALEGVGLKAKRQRSEDEVEELVAQAQEAQQAQQMAELAKTGGAAMRDISAAEATEAA